MKLKELNQYSSMSPKEQTLYTVTHSLIEPFGSHPIGYYLESLLVPGGSYSNGNLFFDIDYIEYSSISDVAFYKVWLDPSIWGTDFPNEEIYSVEEVRTAIKETLLAYGVEYPERQKEALEVIKRYQL
jgi:hypothetical protein